MNAKDKVRSIRKGQCMNREKSECEFLEGERALPLYRGQTERMLRRFFHLSLDLGRLPSVLGGQAFRAKVSSSQAHTFEDYVIFVHDIERCLEELDPSSLETIAAVVFLDQSHEEAAVSLGLSRRQVERRYGAALDRLSRKLLLTELMQPSHLTLQEPECAVCLRNPAFAVEDERVATASSGEETVASLPPKKPAASVRLRTVEQNVSRRASVVRITKPVWPERM